MDSHVASLNHSYQLDVIRSANDNTLFHRYTAPDGSLIVVKFVANEFGYQPESDSLPIAPEFPHPIPDFVLQQIAKAEQEDRDKSREAPSGTYAAP